MYTRKKYVILVHILKGFYKIFIFQQTDLTLHKHSGILDKGFHDTQVDLRLPKRLVITPKAQRSWNPAKDFLGLYINGFLLFQGVRL